MRRTPLALLATTTLASVLASLLAAAGAAEALHPRDLRYPPLAFEGIRPQVLQVDPGVTLIVLEDHELPTVSMTGMLRAGDSLDPPGKVGLAELTAELLRTGGAGRWGGDELDEELDFVAATVRFSTDTEALTLEASSLKRDQELLLDAVVAMLRQPRFEAEKLEVARARMLDELRRQNDEPSGLARRELKKILYGPESPWARTPTAEGLRSISRDDLVAFHRRWVAPNHLILGITGDVTAAELQGQLQTRLAGWAKGEVPERPAPTRQGPRPGLYLARKDLNQTTVRMGHLGLPQLHPDYPACQVLNRILGIGTFTSRMGIEIRSNRGLAYSVGSGLFEGRGPGMFLAVAGTKAESTHEVVGLMKQIIAGMGAGDITDEELESAKSTLLNQWVFEFEGGDKIVSKKVEHQFHAYPADYLEEYPRKISAVTKEDVVRCARTHLRPAELAVLLVGDPGKMGRPLEELGSVSEVELTEVR